MEEDERREKARSRPEKLTFVAVRPEFDKLGRLVDISNTGLCFQYMSDKKPVEDSSPTEVDIFISNNGFYLQGVLCRCIYDSVILDMERLPKEMNLRRCGMKFVNLSGEHFKRLEHYIREYTRRI